MDKKSSSVDLFSMWGAASDEDPESPRARVEQKLESLGLEIGKLAQLEPEIAINVLRGKDLPKGEIERFIYLIFSETFQAKDIGESDSFMVVRSLFGKTTVVSQGMFGLYWEKATELMPCEEGEKERKDYPRVREYIERALRSEEAAMRVYDSSREENAVDGPGSDTATRNNKRKKRGGIRRLFGFAK